MANIQFEDYENRSTMSTGKKDRKVGYFKLKNDGDEAIVRFNYSSPKDFNLVTVHKVKVGDNYRNVSCLREKFDGIDKCPLCSSTDESVARVSTKFFVKLIQYVKDETGSIKPEAVIWERPAGFARELKSYFDEYGDLSNLVFKIKRHGVKGSIDTKYDILPANSMIYKPEIYVKDFSAYEGFELAHHSYMVRTAEEIKAFMETGEFPKREVPVTPTSDAQSVAIGTQHTATGYVPTTTQGVVEDTAPTTPVTAGTTRQRWF